MDSWVRKIHWRRDRLPTPAFLGFPDGSDCNECACNSADRFNPWVRKIPWRRKWQPTLVFLPGESHGQKSLADYSLWGLKELDMTERLNILTFIFLVSLAFLPAQPLILPSFSLLSRRQEFLSESRETFIQRERE